MVSTFCRHIFRNKAGMGCETQRPWLVKSASGQEKETTQKRSYPRHPKRLRPLKMQRIPLQSCLMLICRLKIQKKILNTRKAVLKAILLLSSLNIRIQMLKYLLPLHLCQLWTWKRSWISSRINWQSRTALRWLMKGPTPTIHHLSLKTKNRNKKIIRMEIMGWVHHQTSKSPIISRMRQRVPICWENSQGRAKEKNLAMWIIQSRKQLIRA